MNELALFAGAGGGILGGHLLGWRTVCAVEWEPYAASVLAARQNDGLLPPFPIWDDVQKPLTADLGAAVLMWCQEASRARTSALPERAQALTERAAECGEAWRASLARFDHATSSWRTAQPSLFGDSEECSVTWPRSGMTAGGQCWELPTLGRRISGTGSGLWPTPTSTLGTKGGQVTPTKAREGGTLIEALSARTVWPTPTVCGNYNRKGASASSGDGLATAVLKCATPTACDWRSGKASQATHDKNSRPLSEQIGGSLNPTWVEWLMHWPLNWTSLEPLANEQFDKWAQDGTAVVRGERVRPVWFDAEPTQAPQGSQSIQQRADERGNSVCAVPFSGTQTVEARGLQGVRTAVPTKANEEGDGMRPDMLGGAGQDVGAETLVPRIATGVQARVDRLKAIGNGQVPLCAATAWRLLTA